VAASGHAGRESRPHCSRMRRRRRRRRRCRNRHDPGGGGRRRRGCRPDDQRQLGDRAAVARPRPGERHDVGQHRLQHHGSADQARRGPEPGAQPRRELRDLRGRPHRDDHAARRRRVVERRPGHGGGLRVVVEAHHLARAGGRLRLPVLWHRRSAGVQRLREEELRRAGGQGRRQRGRRPHARDQADLAAAVVHAAARAPLVHGRPSPDGGAVRRQVDRGREHRHERPVPARLVGAQREHQPRQERGLACCRRGHADPCRRADDHRRHDRSPGLRGRRGRRHRRSPGRGDPAPEGDGGLPAVSGSRHLLLRLQRQDDHGREPAPRDVAGDRPAEHHRQRRSGRPAAHDRLHAQGHAWLRPDQPGLPVAAADGGPGAGQDADGAGRQPEDRHQPAPERRTGPPGDRRRGPGSVEGARPERQHQAAGVGAVPRVHRPAAGSVDRRLPARLDRRLRRRDELPRALDERIGEQQHQLRERGVRQRHRRGAPDARQRRPLRAVRPGRGDPRRRGRPDADHADLLVHVHPARAPDGAGDVQPQPPRPGRPNSGRRSGVGRRETLGGGRGAESAPPSPFHAPASTARKMGRSPAR
jgi:hypothetical protein